MGDVDRSPFGNPIPGLKDLGVSKQDKLEPGLRAIDVKSDGPVQVKVIQINEILQVDVDQFAALMDAGITVGAVCSLDNRNGRVYLGSGDN